MNMKDWSTINELDLNNKSISIMQPRRINIFLQKQILSNIAEEGFCNAVITQSMGVLIIVWMLLD